MDKDRGRVSRPHVEPVRSMDWQVPAYTWVRIKYVYLNIVTLNSVILSELFRIVSCKVEAEEN